MFNPHIQKLLDKVELADLSHYDSATSTFYIPKRVDIKLDVDKVYLIHLKDSFFTNSTLRVNWNNDTVPPYPYLKFEVDRIVAKMIKGIGIGYDPVTDADLDKTWEGWLNKDNIEILKKL